MSEKSDWQKLHEECSDTGWTFKSLHHHFYKQLEAQENLTKERIDNIKHSIEISQKTAESALVKAEVNLAARLDALNELRSMVADQQGHFADRDKTEYRLGKLETVMDVDTGKSQGYGITGLVVVGAFAVLANIVSIIIAFRVQSGF